MDEKDILWKKGVETNGKKGESVLLQSSPAHQIFLSCSVFILPPLGPVADAEQIMGVLFENMNFSQLLCAYYSLIYSLIRKWDIKLHPIV